MSGRKILQQHLSRGAKVFQDINVKANSNSVSTPGDRLPSLHQRCSADTFAMPFSSCLRYQSQAAQGKSCPHALCQTVHSAGACLHVPRTLQVHRYSPARSAVVNCRPAKSLYQVAAGSLACSCAGKLGSGHHFGRNAAWHHAKRSSHAVGEHDRLPKSVVCALGKDAACPPHLQIPPRSSQGPARSSTTSAVAVRTDTASLHSQADWQPPQQPSSWRSGHKLNGAQLNGEARRVEEAASASHLDQVPSFSTAGGDLRACMHYFIIKGPPENPQENPIMYMLCYVHVD